MIVCKTTDKIIIAFDNEIIVCKNDHGYPVDKNYHLEY